MQPAVPQLTLLLHSVGESGAGARAGIAQKAGGERKEGTAAPHGQVREVGKSVLNGKFGDGSTVGYFVCVLVPDLLAPFVEKNEHTT